MVCGFDQEVDLLSRFDEHIHDESGGMKERALQLCSGASSETGSMQVCQEP